MADYTSIGREQALDYMAQFPGYGEMRSYTDALGAEHLADGVRDDDDRFGLSFGHPAGHLARERAEAPFELANTGLAGVLLDDRPDGRVADVELLLEVEELLIVDEVEGRHERCRNGYSGLVGKLSLFVVLRERAVGSRDHEDGRRGRVHSVAQALHDARMVGVDDQLQGRRPVESDALRTVGVGRDRDPFEGCDGLG